MVAGVNGLGVVGWGDACAACEYGVGRPAGASQVGSVILKSTNRRRIAPEVSSGSRLAGGGLEMIIFLHGVA